MGLFVIHHRMVITNNHTYRMHGFENEENYVWLDYFKTKKHVNQKVAVFSALHSAKLYNRYS
jgi:hypothetical protein